MIAVAVVVLVVTAFLLGRNSMHRRREQRLRSQGDHVDSSGQERRSRESCSLRSLSDDERARYVQRWRHLQRQFAKQPATGLLEADALLTRVLNDVGYPIGSFEQLSGDLSAAHADVVDDYRAARCVVLDTRLGLAGTAEIRHAMPRYRTVFERIAEADVSYETDEAAS